MKKKNRKIEENRRATQHENWNAINAIGRKKYDEYMKQGILPFL